MDNLLNKEPVKRVEKVLGQFDQSIKIQILDKTARTAKDAAESLKTEVGSIVKSLLLRTKTSFLLCLVAGDKRCSLNKVKKLLNQKDVSMANAEQVKKMRQILEGMSLQIATPDEAREILHLKGADQVNF